MKTLLQKTLMSFALSLVLIASPCLAFKQDVHYALTLRLARAAGFSDDAALRIANGNVRQDRGSLLPGTWQIAFHLLVMGDENGAIEAQRRHFPSTTVVPADPSERVVLPGSNAARRMLDQVIENAAEYSLNDAWIGSERPCIRCRIHGHMREYPIRLSGVGGNRNVSTPWLTQSLVVGGPGCPSADDAQLHPDDALAALEVTYRYLTAFEHPELDRVGAVRLWEEVRDEVSSFLGGEALKGLEFRGLRRSPNAPN